MANILTPLSKSQFITNKNEKFVKYIEKQQYHLMLLHCSHMFHRKRKSTLFSKGHMFREIITGIGKEDMKEGTFYIIVLPFYPVLANIFMISLETSVIPIVNYKIIK